MNHRRRRRFVQHKKQSCAVQQNTKKIEIVETPNGFYVHTDNQPIAGPFATNAEAWKWLDRNDADAIRMDNTRMRIANAFADG